MSQVLKRVRWKIAKIQKKKNRALKSSYSLGWWLTPVILATQWVEVRRIMVQSQPRQIVRETILKKNLSQKRAGGVAQGVGPVLGEKKFVSFDTSHFMSVEVHYSFKINAIMEIVLRVHRYIMEYS
jgi:hypothetical protein